MNGPGKLIGVGIGPGDPELVTLKAIRVLKAAHVVAHFAKAGQDSNSRAAVAEHVRKLGAPTAAAERNQAIADNREVDAGP